MPFNSLLEMWVDSSNWTMSSHLAWPWLLRPSLCSYLIDKVTEATKAKMACLRPYSRYVAEMGFRLTLPVCLKTPVSMAP